MHDSIRCLLPPQAPCSLFNFYHTLSQTASNCVYTAVESIPFEIEELPAYKFIVELLAHKHDRSQSQRILAIQGKQQRCRRRHKQVRMKEVSYRTYECEPPLLTPSPTPVTFPHQQHDFLDRPSKPDSAGPVPGTSSSGSDTVPAYGISGLFPNSVNTASAQSPICRH